MVVQALQRASWLECDLNEFLYYSRTILQLWMWTAEAHFVWFSYKTATQHRDDVNKLRTSSSLSCLNPQTTANTMRSLLVFSLVRYHCIFIQFTARNSWTDRLIISDRCTRRRRAVRRSRTTSCQLPGGLPKSSGPLQVISLSLLLPRLPPRVRCSIPNLHPWLWSGWNIEKGIQGVTSWI